MNNTPKISVIIPVYGVEDYIEKCLQSLLDQTFTDFEAIIVDDGSLDQSIPKAKKLVGDDTRFVFLEKENGGQASARNMGIDHAKGKYLAFIDSDDYVSPLYLQIMYGTILKHNSDICVCNAFLIKNDQVIGNIENNYSKYIEERDIFLCKDTVSSFMWDKLFKKEVFNNMRFDESIRTYEDSHFVFRLIYNKTFCQVNKSLYFYVQRDGSTTNGFNPTLVKDKKSVYESYITFYEKEMLKNNISSKYLEYCYLKVYIYSTAASIAHHSNNFKKDYSILKKTIDSSLFQYSKIFNSFFKEPKILLGLLTLKTSPILFKYMIKLRDSIK